METSLKTGLAQIFSCCPKNLSCPKLGGAAAPLAPPARTPMFLGVKGAIYYVAIAKVIFSHVKISSFRVKAHLVFHLVFQILKKN